MSGRVITVDGERWEISPSGHSTVYGKDQFGLVFQSGTGPDRKRRFTRFSPVGHRSPDAAFAELAEPQLYSLFRQSQPSWTSPESAYGAR